MPRPPCPPYSRPPVHGFPVRGSFLSRPPAAAPFSSPQQPRQAIKPLFPLDISGPPDTMACWLAFVISFSCVRRAQPMRTRCPHCGQLAKVADASEGRIFRCPRCGRAFPAARVVPAPAVAAPRRTRHTDMIVRLWSGCPRAFRTAFLTTMGVLSAAFLSLIFYMNILRPKAQPPPLVLLEAQLQAFNIFRDAAPPSRTVFRGRWLTAHRFTRDALNPDRYFRVYVDDAGSPVGCATSWTGYNCSCPAAVLRDRLAAPASMDLCAAFQALTGSVLPIETRKTYRTAGATQELVFPSHGWTITISRLLTADTPIAPHCSLHGEGPQVYRYTATAHKW